MKGEILGSNFRGNKGTVYISFVKQGSYDKNINTITALCYKAVSKHISEVRKGIFYLLLLGIKGIV